MNSIRRIYRCVWLLLFSVAACTLSFPLDNTRKIGQFTHTAWGEKEGAPRTIWAIAQTKDGYLWLAANDGLFRFDGLTFEHYEPQSGPTLPPFAARSLLALPNGDLWIGFSSGAISLLRNGRVENYTSGDGVPEGNVRCLARDGVGTIWAGTDTGLARFVGNRWEKVGGESNFFLKFVRSLFVDRKGTLWVSATNDAIVFLPQGATTFQSTSLRVGQVMQIVEAPNGKLWMAETTRSVRPIPLGVKLPPSDSVEVRVGSGAILFPREGDLWIGTVGDGIRRAPVPEQLTGKPGRFSSAVESFTAKNGLTDNFVLSIFQDHEGNIWTGTLSGLDRFRMGGLVPVTVPLWYPIPILAPGDSGDLWALLDRGLVHIDKFSAKEIKYSGRLILDTASESSGAIWVISSRLALLRFENGHFSRFPLPRGLPSPYSPRITRDRSDVLWMAIQQQGLFYLEKGRWSRFDIPPELSKQIPTTAFTDGLGRAWFGYDDGSIIYLDGGKIQTVSTGRNSPVAGVAIIQGRKRHVWVGGKSGLVLFDEGRFQKVVPADASSFAGVSGIAELADGSLWLCEKQGVIHISVPEVRKFLETPSYRVHYQIFDSSDGLPGAFLARQRLVEGTDGRIWVGADHGIAWINPAAIPAGVRPPISIRSVTAAGKRFAVQPDLTLPPRSENLRVEYTAVNLSVPERVRYRYKLDGVDKDWQDAGVRREAFYTNLGPGKYRFHTNARNEGGEWNTEEAVLDFTIAPAWFQTIQFRAFCGCVFLILLWMLYQLRLRHLERQFAMRLEIRVSERTRIARDLHDTLLQTLHGLMFQFQAVRNLMPRRPDEAMKSLDDAIDETEKALTESRDAIQGLRSEPSANGNLAELLMATSQELASSENSNHHPPSFELLEEGERRSLSATTNNEVCWIALEILRNAYRHAQARRIETEVRYGDDTLRLRIRDDGKGIEANVLKEGGIAGHWGLQGIRERAERLGAQLDFWSEAGAGTEVQLAVPASVAYEASRDGIGSTLFRRRREHGQRS